MSKRDPKHCPKAITLTERTILRFLACGEATARDMAESLPASREHVYRSLADLQSRRYVDISGRRRAGAFRPASVFHITDAGAAAARGVA